MVAVEQDERVMKEKDRSIYWKRAMGIWLIVCLLLASCKNMNKSQKGTYIGAAGGAAAGAAIGKAAGNTAMGAILGAAIGGAAGYGIGRYMDKQAEELRADLEGAEIERVGEGIKITFHDGIQFEINSSDLSDASRTNLTNLAETLKKYEDTNILIEGHTDITGTREYNMELSEDRAESVEDYLKSLGVAGRRISTEGYGPDQPVASNDTPDGRRQNRRVEVAIFANEKLKRKAEKGELGDVTADEQN